MAPTDPVVQSNGHDPDPRPACKVVWAIPDEGYTQSEALANIRLLSFHHGKLEAQAAQDRTGPRWEFSLFHYGRLFTPLAREYAAKAALSIGAEYLLMTDNDGIFPIDLFERLVRHQVDIVAPLAFTRNDPYLPVIYCMEEGFDTATRKPYSMSRYVTKYPKNAVVECDAVGFHAVLIRMAIFQKISPPYFFNLASTGEDIYFCLRARKEAGARVFCDTSISTGHLTKPSIVDEAFAMAYWRDGLHMDPDKGMGSVSRYQSVPMAPGGQPYTLGNMNVESTDTIPHHAKVVAQ